MSIAANLNSDSTLTQHTLQEIVSSVESVSFGSVEVTIHDGKVVQMETRKKIRFSLDVDVQHSRQVV